MGAVITFAQQKGGSGKTTLLTCLAHAFSEAGKSVAVADLDPQGSLAAWLKLGQMKDLALIETASYRVAGDLRSAKSAHDIVLVDCPGSASPLLEAAIRESDLVLIPCQTSPMDIWATGAIIDMAQDEKTPVRVVLNRVAPRGRAAQDTRDQLAKAGTPVLNAQFGNRVAFVNGFAAGQSPLSMPGQQVAKGEIAEFAKEVLAHLD